jgi:hypothetical protein
MIKEYAIKNLPPSKINKMNMSQLNKRIKSINNALVKQRKIDIKEKGSYYYSSKWKNLLTQLNWTTDALRKKE